MIRVMPSGGTWSLGSQATITRMTNGAAPTWKFGAEPIALATAGHPRPSAVAAYGPRPTSLGGDRTGGPSHRAARRRAARAGCTLMEQRRFDRLWIRSREGPAGAGQGFGLLDQPETRIGGCPATDGCNIQGCCSRSAKPTSMGRRRRRRLLLSNRHHFAPLRTESHGQFR